MLGVMKCPTNLENYCVSGSGTRNSFLSSAGNHPRHLSTLRLNELKGCRKKIQRPSAIKCVPRHKQLTDKDTHTTYNGDYECPFHFPVTPRLIVDAKSRSNRDGRAGNKIYRGVTAWSFLSLGCAPARWLARRGSSESRSRSLVRLRLCSFYSTGERNERVCV